MSQLNTMQDDALPIRLPRLAMRGGPCRLQIADALQAGRQLLPDRSTDVICVSPVMHWVPDTAR